MRYLFFLIFLMISACKTDEKSFKGTWKVNEIHWISADTTYSIKHAQPGIFMVSDSRYSIIWTPTEKKREPFKKLAYPTDEEIIQGFRSIVFNSGTYSLSDSIFEIQALIAKVPGFEGGRQKFAYQIEGKQLRLRMIDETYPNGDKPDWYGKWETLFVMERLD